MAAIPPQHTRVHEEARLSANELAKYMVASDTGKIGILQRAKNSGTAPRTRYSDVRSALREALVDAVGERRILDAARDTFEQRSNDTALTGYVRNDAVKSIDVLDAYAAMRNQLAGHDVIKAPRVQPHLILSGVDISVNCDLLIHRSHRGAEEIGGLLFRLSKPDEEESERAAAKRKDMGLYAATLIYMHVSQNMAGNRSPSPAICWSVEVQGQ